MRILYVTTTRATMNFFAKHIALLQEEGHVVEMATHPHGQELHDELKAQNCKMHSIPFSRKPLCKDNLIALRQLKKLIAEGNYDIVHTHTPNASVIVRWVCRKLRKKGLKVFYTAHGFHFYKGAPLKNWMMYYPLEWLCARWTDTLITINQEDYNRAKKSFRAKQVVYVPGVGIDIDKFANAKVDWKEKRKEIGVPEDAFLLLSVGALSYRKNFGIVIESLAHLKNSQIHYVIAGSGVLKDKLEEKAKSLGVDKQVHLLGYRNDIAELNKAADVLLLPSFQEGLPVAIMEAMASGKPVIASDIRGNRDLIDSSGGALCKPDDACAFAAAIMKMMETDRQALGAENQRKVQFASYADINEKMRSIYAQ